jgi:superfamily II DNA or RNA helicase
MIHFKNLLSIDLKAEFEKNKDKLNLKSPREHQIKAHKEMTKFFMEDATENAGILVLPTGGGKTYTSVYWILKNIISKNKKVLWLADQGFLLEQARETFRENILEVDKQKREFINIRIVSGSDKHSNPNQIAISDDILLITAQTAISNWEDEYETKFKQFINSNAKEGNLFIVYDEAHHTPAFGRRNLLIGGTEGRTGILEKFTKTQLLGLTATPTYTNKNQRGWLWEIFKGGIIYEITKKELEDKKILATPNFIQQKTNFELALTDNDIDKVIFKHQEIPAHIIEEIAKKDSRNDFIAQYYIDNKVTFGKTIIFFDRWYQCKRVEDYINKKAGKEIAASIFSYTDTNKNIDYINNRSSNQNEINLERFRKGEIDVLINVKMLTEGVDVPDVKTVFLTRDTNSTILFTQMVGRALRGEGAGGNKTTANIVLFSDNWNRHVQFASNRYFGGKSDSEIKERGYRPLELISIRLLESLEIEYQNQDYENSVMDLIPIGWYVVAYTDTISEEDENNEIQKITDNFLENIVVLEHEKLLLEKFIQDFYNEDIWQKEELDFETTENKINHFLNFNNYKTNKAIVVKLIQIARHLGQNDTKPEYYTFEQKNEINIKKYVLEILGMNLGIIQVEDYLEDKYYKSENPFLRVIFPNYEEFYRAYEYEYNVYRRKRKGNVNVSEASQKINTQRLASKEIEKIIFSRDNHRCLCCGSSKKLQKDHIISFKHEEPDNGNPELFQTICKICNGEKSSYSYNFRTTNYDFNKMSLENVNSTPNENPINYFTRLINCYFKTSAVQPDFVSASNHGLSVWKAALKYGVDPKETILTQKEELIEIIKSKGFKLKDIEIVSK